MPEQNDKRGGQMYIVFNAYLETLRGEEGTKPPSQRRSVPTVKELAGVVGVHELSLHNIVNGKVKRLNIVTMQAVLDEMWRRGFEPELSDFIRYKPPEV